MNPFARTVHDAVTGDRSAREHLLSPQLHVVRAYVRLQMGHDLRMRESVSDLVQTVFRQALVDLGGFRGADERSFRAWLLTLAAHKIHDRRRYWQAGKRDIARDHGGADAVEFAQSYAMITPSRVAAAREEVARVEAAFDQLTEDQREVLALTCVAGLSHREVAERMERSEDASRALLNRARARLAMLLAGDQ